MFFCEYNLDLNQKFNQYIQEFNMAPQQPDPQQQQPQDPQQQQQQDPQQQDQQQPEAIPSTEIKFENIKRYVLYSRLKSIRYDLETNIKIDRLDPEVINIFEFIDLLLLFYNTFTYPETIKLIDMLIEYISEKFKIKLPNRSDDLDDETNM